MDGDVLLVEGHLEELLVGELQRLVDHAGHGQLPVGSAQSRREELRVDPIEIVIRHHERRDARHVQAGARRQRGDGLDGRWRRFHRRCFPSPDLQQGPTDGAAGQGRDTERQRVTDETSARPVRHLRSRGLALFVGCRNPQEARQNPPGDAQ